MHLYVIQAMARQVFYPRFQVVGQTGIVVFGRYGFTAPRIWYFFSGALLQGGLNAVFHPALVLVTQDPAGQARFYPKLKKKRSLTRLKPKK